MRIKLYTYQGQLLSLTTIADRLNIPISTVHHQLNRHREPKKHDHIATLFMQWNIEPSPTNRSRYQKGWTLSEIANGQERFILNPDIGYND